MNLWVTGSWVVEGVYNNWLNWTNEMVLGDRSHHANAVAYAYASNSLSVIGKSQEGESDTVIVGSLLRAVLSE